MAVVTKTVKYFLLTGTAGLYKIAFENKKLYGT